MDGLSAILQSFADVLRPLIEFLTWLWPIKIYRLHDGELGIIRTFGKVRNWRTSKVKSGMGICFIFEEMDIIQAEGGFINCTEQTIYTKDKKILQINASIEYSIFCVQSAILKTERIEDLVEGYCVNYIREYAQGITYNDLLDNDKINEVLTSKINRKIKKHGAKIDHLMITDLRPHTITMICDTIREVTEKGINFKKEN